MQVFISKQMSLMNKILFSDFDGTLFFKEGFHQEDIEAIKTFQSKGNKFALCTGRPLGGVNALMKGKIIPDYYVLCTGGLVFIFLTYFFNKFKRNFLCINNLIILI